MTFERVSPRASGGRRMNTGLHPLAHDAMRLALRPQAEAERRLAELAGGDITALDLAHRDLCRRLGERPHDVPASVALRLVHRLRDRVQSQAEEEATSTSTDVGLAGVSA